MVEILWCLVYDCSPDVPQLPQAFNVILSLGDWIGSVAKRVGTRSRASMPSEMISSRSTHHD